MTLTEIVECLELYLRFVKAKHIDQECIHKLEQLITIILDSKEETNKE